MLHIHRVGLWLGVLLCSLGDAVAQQAPALPVTLNIESQPLTEALNAWAAQTGYMVLVPTAGDAPVVMAPRVTGQHTPEDALKLLLDNSGYQYQFVGDRTVTINPKAVNSITKLDSQGPSAGRPRHCSGLSSNKLDAATSPNQTGSDSTAINWTGAEGASDCIESYSPENQVLARRIASTEGGPVQNSDGVSNLNKDSTEGRSITEIVVTAQKRSERLQDVPVAVTAIDANALTSQNLLRLQDYYTRIPDLNLTTNPFGGVQLIIRGLDNGGGPPTVGTVIDDIPYGGTRIGWLGAPDLDPSILAGVEVLRGPQGTLYGASSIGGLLKYVTVNPSTDRFGGRVETDLGGVSHGSDASYAVRGSVNIPLSDVLAVSASGFLRHEPGFVDNIQTGQRDVNSADYRGGRLAALWRFTPDFSLKLSALYQHSNQAGGSQVDVGPAFGDLQQSALRNTGTYDNNAQLYSATISGKIDGIELTSLTGYSIFRSDDVYDWTPIFGSLAQQTYDVGGFALPSQFKESRISQEFRAAADLGKRINWLLGVYYSDEKVTETDQYLVVDPVTGMTAGSVGFDRAPNGLSEYATFTDLTFRLSDRLDVQVGGRESWIKTTYSEVDTGTVFGGGVVVTPEARTNERAFTYLVTPKFKVSDDLMVYSRLASGYRPGGPNSNCVLLQAPCAIEPDKTKGAELGLKGDLLNHKLSFDASLYYTDWTNIQIGVVNAQQFGYTINAGGAKSQGAELSAQARLTQGLTVAGWIAWNDAELTKDLPPPNVGLKGSKLPYSSSCSGNLALSEETLLSDSVIGFFSGTLSYIGARPGGYISEPKGFSAYVKGDVQLGLRRGGWTVRGFVNNVTDTRALALAGLIDSSAVVYIRPRTFGMSISREF